MTDPTEDGRRVVRIEMVWATTDGHRPEAVTVSWVGEMPPADVLCQVVREMADAGPRYEVKVEEAKPNEYEPCARATCRHIRGQHFGYMQTPEGQGNCAICAESVPCPGFVTEAELRQEG